MVVKRSQVHTMVPPGKSPPTVKPHHKQSEPVDPGDEYSCPEDEYSSPPPIGKLAIIGAGALAGAGVFGYQGMAGYGPVGAVCFGIIGAAMAGSSLFLVEVL